ncbi:hypothetical protein F503_08500 [Ophiostoma piceae UAMH 11346]|uniref:Duf167 domain protein n=1 Tax=Ophiostoma piceae (strain UAMH 11346) TaxID=1262450 RepID=S3BQU4_OPHP1|nr:hypothetical protein F503_08500 [Ophiostoma piceae UAMH 11346]
MAAVLRYVSHARASATGTLFVLCHVRPRASKIREGVTAVTDDAVEICVSAPPRNGESNKAVIDVLHKALDIPKSRIEVFHGKKSRDKVIAVTGMSEREHETEDLVERMHHLLTQAVLKGKEP